MASHNAAEDGKGRPGHEDNRVSRPTEQELQEFTTSTSNSNSNSNSGITETEQVVVESLDSMARWILSIPPAHATVLQHMRQYRELQQAFGSLQREHEKLVASSWQRRQQEGDDHNNDNSNDNNWTKLTATKSMQSPTVPLLSSSSSSSFSLLTAISDDLVLRILDFLQAVSLAQVMQTCCRFRDLVLRNAQRRTTKIAAQRQLPHVLQLLRAQEHIIQGTTTTTSSSSFMMSSAGGTNTTGGPFVRVPTLLLSRCVLVTDASDADFNGIYHCTGINGNGFVFTKPREPFQRVQRRRRRSNDEQRRPGSTGDPGTQVVIGEHVSQAIVSSRQHNSNNSNNDDSDTDDDDDTDDEDEDGNSLLRCIVAKRFSNETLLWYMSKEMVATDAGVNNNQAPPHHYEESSTPVIGRHKVYQRFSYWARLSQVGDASPDLCRYPSQTSILRRSNNNGEEGWQSLTPTRDATPPTVELIN